MDPGRAAVLAGVSRKIPTLENCVLTVTELLAGIGSVVRDLVLAVSMRVVEILTWTPTLTVMLAPLARSPSEQETSPVEPNAGRRHRVAEIPEVR